MTETLAIVSVIISGLMMLAVTMLSLVFKFLHRDFSNLREFTQNHITDILEDIGKIKGKLKIND